MAKRRANSDRIACTSGLEFSEGQAKTRRPNHELQRTAGTIARLNWRSLAPPSLSLVDMRLLSSNLLEKVSPRCQFE